MGGHAKSIAGSSTGRALETVTEQLTDVVIISDRALVAPPRVAPLGASSLGRTTRGVSPYATGACSW
ncbi:hypothetical protein C3Y87_11720 [Carbonactinospora thermoautotrophica]|uniref:Uncharacterized protein n=1 Tax=Carbonactinospora thermoautotrophica TaxID=1469144 RepID=A0A132MIZ0_9ACTN|nr:hypothetical protein [Carbonactinospora thermoautotrophica]KWW97822.1 hypothetical protein TH66_20500 [Carbonactinospora thermoautotrophica]KWX09296.1 hypothetical protein TR74_10440 [Carbonactinospora thermoautotrophica]MCX9192069.1 hypothetical protein [Carbonactinospora thermoautotrophica]